MLEMESSEIAGQGVTTIGDFKITTENEVPNGSHLVLTEAEVPHNTQDTIYSSPGHITNFPVDILDPSDVYFVKKISKATGEPVYTAYGAINPERLASNKDFQENKTITTPKSLIGELDETTPIQELVFNLIHQELNQGSHEERMSMLRDQLEMKKNYPNNEALNNNINRIIDLIDTRFEVEYNQAIAANKLLKGVDNPQSYWREVVESEVNNILKPDDSDQITPIEDRIDQIHNEVKALVEAY